MQKAAVPGVGRVRTAIASCKRIKRTETRERGHERVQDFRAGFVKHIWPWSPSPGQGVAGCHIHGSVRCSVASPGSAGTAAHPSTHPSLQCALLSQTVTRYVGEVPHGLLSEWRHAGLVRARRRHPPLHPLLHCALLMSPTFPEGSEVRFGPAWEQRHAGPGDGAPPSRAYVRC